MAQVTTAPGPGTASPASNDAPIVLDLGKRSRKQVRRLRKGTGKLMDKISELVGDLKADGTVAADAQPIIIVVRPKRKRSVFGL